MHQCHDQFDQCLVLFCSVLVRASGVYTATNDIHELREKEGGREAIEGGLTLQ